MHMQMNNCDKNMQIGYIHVLILYMYIIQCTCTVRVHLQIHTFVYIHVHVHLPCRQNSGNDFLINCRNSSSRREFSNSGSSELYMCMQHNRCKPYILYFLKISPHLKISSQISANNLFQ